MPGIRLVRSEKLLRRKIFILELNTRSLSLDLLTTHMTTVARVSGLSSNGHAALVRGEIPEQLIGSSPRLSTPVHANGAGMYTFPDSSRRTLLDYG